MKFLKQEYEDLQRTIQSRKLDANKFQYTKKRGHLYIMQEGRDDQFCFFRKEDTILNDQLQWEKKVTYYVDPKNQVQVDSWQQVLQGFAEWLDGQ